MKLNIGKKRTIYDSNGKKIATYATRGIDEPDSVFVPLDKRGYGNRPSSIMKRRSRNPSEGCRCGGTNENCEKCGGSGKK